MSVEPADYVARLRAQANDPRRDEALRRDRTIRRRKFVLAAGAGVLLLGGFGFWLADATGERPPYEPFGARALDEEMWPSEWPYSVRMPFRDSPAFGWASGADGIRVPTAVPAGGLTAKGMTAVLEDVRTVLAETNVSEQTLAGAEPAAALALLDPSGVDDAVRKDMITRFAPEKVYLHESGVRTRGTMSYEVLAAGELVVHADYTFVYPLVRADGGPQVAPGVPEVARVAVRRQMTFTLRDGKLVIGAYASEVGNHDCSAPKDGYLHPFFAEGRWKAAQAAKGSLVDFYDEKRVLTAGPGRCVTPIRT